MVIGLLAIGEATTGHFKSSGWLILLCVLLDKADGTVARLLRASSRFGVQMDSLSDFLTFGVAPAVLVHARLLGPHASGILEGMEIFQAVAWVGCPLYVVCAALRLAKFNVISEDFATTHFFGTPTTLAGAFIGAYYLTVDKYALAPIFTRLLAITMVVFALLMISRIPLRKLGPRPSLPFNALLFVNVFLVYLFGILRIYPEYLLSVGVVYLVIGHVWATVAGVRMPSADSGADQA
jgi:CDP-diacylglycerol--serine O-phosphatidyltransferase